MAVAAFDVAHTDVGTLDATLSRQSAVVEISVSRLHHRIAVEAEVLMVRLVATKIERQC